VMRALRRDLRAARLPHEVAAAVARHLRRHRQVRRKRVSLRNARQFRWRRPRPRLLMTTVDEPVRALVRARRAAIEAIAALDSVAATRTTVAVEIVRETDTTTAIDARASAVAPVRIRDLVLDPTRRAGTREIAVSTDTL